MLYEEYPMLSKTSIDTRSDNWGTWYISPKATILASWHVTGDIIPTKADGQAIEKNTADIFGILHSGPSLAESFYLLHGNDSGEVLSEVTANAHNYFDMWLQDMKDASDYWYYKVDNNLTFENYRCNPSAASLAGVAFANTYQGRMVDFTRNNPTLEGF